MVARKEMFRSASFGDFAGVFEYDGETGYLYLFDNGRAADRRIVGPFTFSRELLISRSPESRCVGTTKDCELACSFVVDSWAEFDAVRGVGFGGDYKPGGTPKLFGWGA
jgi:hypothetical protein